MIDPITLTVGIGMGAFLLGYIAHSNNDNKSANKNIETMLEQNREVISLSSTIEILNRDMDKKNIRIAEMAEEINHQQENIDRLLQRADYVRNSGELQKLEELAQTTKNLRRIKENLSKIQGKNADRYNIGVLISLVQTQYEYIHNEELDMLGVQHLMEDFSDSGSDSKGDALGGMAQKQTRPKKIKPNTLGVGHVIKQKDQFQMLRSLRGSALSEDERGRL